MIRIFNIAWTALAFVLVIAPVGLALRLGGADRLTLKRRPPGESYWRTCPPLPTSSDPSA